MVSNTNKASDKNIYEGIGNSHINQISTNSPLTLKKKDKHLVFTEYYYPKYSDLYTNGDYFDIYGKLLVRNAKVRFDTEKFWIWGFLFEKSKKIML